MLDLNKIYNDDCLNVVKLMDDKSVDIIITDPPYFMNYKTNRRKDKTHKFCSAIDNDANPELLSLIMPELYRVLKDNSAMYMFCNNMQLPLFMDTIGEFFKIKNTIIWVKNNWSAGDLTGAYAHQYELCIYATKGRRELSGGRDSDVWFYDKVVGNNQLHQNQKPKEMIIKMLEKSSNINDTCFDPFMGSGTTAVSCIDTKRQYIGCELDKEYYGIACKRTKEAQEAINGQLF